MKSPKSCNFKVFEVVVVVSNVYAYRWYIGRIYNTLFPYGTRDLQILELWVIDMSIHYNSCTIFVSIYHHEFTIKEYNAFNSTLT